MVTAVLPEQGKRPSGGQAFCTSDGPVKLLHRVSDASPRELHKTAFGMDPAAGRRKAHDHQFPLGAATPSGAAEPPGRSANKVTSTRRSGARQASVSADFGSA